MPATKSYPEQYAIAIKDSGDLFLFIVIRRDIKGNVYVNFNEHHSGNEPHSSYHASGQLHYKSHKRIIFL